MRKILNLFCGIVLMMPLCASAQLYEVSLDEKLAQSVLVAEGRVIGQTSFWNPAHTMIYTANQVEVYKTFKGRLQKEVIEVLTHGGSVGNFAVEASDLLSLDIGNTGILFCMPNTASLRSPISGELLYDVYSSSQGFLAYNLSANKASAPFAEYNDIEGRLYPLLQQKIGSIPSIINRTFRAIPPPKKGGMSLNGSSTITSFFPATINAGALNDPAHNLLTLEGSGFGAGVSGNQLIFKDGNSGNPSVYYVVNYNSPYVTSWADNQIKVKVPSRAATGQWGVVLEPGDTSFAPAPLRVGFSALNASFSSGAAVAEPRLMNANGAGGYTIVYSTSTNGQGVNITTDSAYDCFRRALRTWQELAGANVVEGGNTTSQLVSAGDGVNVIMYDNENTGNAPMGAGVLATTYSSYYSCNVATLTAQKLGFDIVINRAGVSGNISQPFNKSFCNPVINTYDMEAVLLHELGHALNLGHAYGPSEQTSGYTNRNPGMLMHPSINLSVGRKSLDISSVEGAQYTITPQAGNSFGTCRFLSVMQPQDVLVSAYDECPGSFPSQPTPSGTQFTIDLSKTTSNRFADPSFTGIGTANTTSGTGVTVTNNAYYAIRTDNGGSFDLQVTDYITQPAGMADECPGVGVRMAIYQVDECPQGQNFPAPVFIAIFNGNGVGSLAGLLANTNYLLYFDGISNTKAIFTATLVNGTALPLVLKSFTGTKAGAVNKLLVDIQQSTGIASVQVEKSKDAALFFPLQALVLDASGGKTFYTITDASPLDGSNYYRLKIVHVDGSIEYSKTVLLDNAFAGSVVVYPNPVGNKLTVSMAASIKGWRQVIISDAAGRTVFAQKTTNPLLDIPFAAYPRGVYFVKVIGADDRQLLL